QQLSRHAGREQRPATRRVDPHRGAGPERRRCAGCAGPSTGNAVRRMTPSHADSPVRFRPYYNYHHSRVSHSSTTMSRALAFLLLLVLALPLVAEDKPAPKKGIEGYWLGTIHAGAIDLRMGFDIKKKDDGTLTATLDSIDQGARDIPLDSATFVDDTL